MKKERDYETLHAHGLPIPDYAVFDESCLVDARPSELLSSVVQRIFTRGSGMIGLRTEPRAGASPLGNYPHIMPLTSETEVREAMRSVLDRYPHHSWWFLINEAFTDYSWNAVVMISTSGSRNGFWGEVNDMDNLPLREALANTSNCVPVSQWRHGDASWLRTSILRSGLIDQWLEVSAVSARGTHRKVFWGLR